MFILITKIYTRISSRHKGNYDFVRSCLRRFHVVLVSRKISKVCKVCAMKKFLIACFGLGIAIGGGYLMYRKWRKYSSEESDDADNQNDDGTTQDSVQSAEPVKNTQPSTTNGGGKDKQYKAKSNTKTGRTAKNFGGLKSGFLL